MTQHVGVNLDADSRACITHDSFNPLAILREFLATLIQEKLRMLHLTQTGALPPRVDGVVMQVFHKPSADIDVARLGSLRSDSMPIARVESDANIGLIVRGEIGRHHIRQWECGDFLPTQACLQGETNQEPVMLIVCSGNQSLNFVFGQEFRKRAVLF